MFSKISKNIYLMKQLYEEIYIFKFKDFLFLFSWLLHTKQEIDYFRLLNGSATVVFGFQENPRIFISEETISAALWRIEAPVI